MPFEDKLNAVLIITFVGLVTSAFVTAALEPVGQAVAVVKPKMPELALASAAMCASR